MLFGYNGSGAEELEVDGASEFYMRSHHYLKDWTMPCYSRNERRSLVDVRVQGRRPLFRDLLVPFVNAGAWPARTSKATDTPSVHSAVLYVYMGLLRVDNKLTTDPEDMDQDLKELTHLHSTSLEIEEREMNAKMNADHARKVEETQRLLEELMKNGPSAKVTE